MTASLTEMKLFDEDMPLEDLKWRPGSEIVLKPERETVVRALLKERDVLAVLPKGYGPRKKRFCHCQRRFQRRIEPFHA